MAETLLNPFTDVKEKFLTLFSGTLLSKPRVAHSNVVNWWVCHSGSAIASSLNYSCCCCITPLTSCITFLIGTNRPTVV